MSWFQLDPSSIANRARLAGTAVPTLGASIVRGMTGFSVVSIAGFVPWAIFGRALRQHVGEAGLYITCALVFIGLSAPAMHRLIIGPGSFGRFFKLFSLSFAVYAVAWILGWMALRGNVGSIAGLLGGTLVMGLLLSTAFDAYESAVKIVASLFVLNSAGYFIGGIFEGPLMHANPLLAKLQWGLCYGLGFGAGLGSAFYFCQSRARSLLSGSTPTV
jgi:hypothetical protein